MYLFSEKKILNNIFERPYLFYSWISLSISPILINWKENRPFNAKVFFHVYLPIENVRIPMVRTILIFIKKL